MEALELKLQSYLERQMTEASDLQIKGFFRVPYGGSKETYLFDLTWQQDGASHTGEYALRYEAPDNILEVGFAKEARTFKCFETTNIPVPKLHWAETDSDILGRLFVIVERVTGDVTSIGKLLAGEDEKLRNQRAEVAMSLVADFHTLDWQAHGFDFLGVPKTSAEFAETQLEFWKSLYDQSLLEPSPVISDAFAWLKRNIPKTSELTLVHGDLKTDNFMFNGSDVRALLDWEMAAIGDPLADVAWFCMDTWSVNGLAGGMVEKDAFKASWEAKTGYKIDSEAFLFWEVFSCFKLFTIHNRMCHSLITGANKSLARVIPAFINPIILKELCMLLKY